jgi:hypothetical protein
MKKLTFILISVLTLGLFLSTQTFAQTKTPATAGRTYVIPLDPVAERGAVAATGVTMAYYNSAVQNGVSLFGVVDTSKYALATQSFTITPGTMYLASSATTTGSTIWSIYYACSDLNNSVTTWESVGKSGLTLYTTGYNDSGVSLVQTIARTNVTGRYLAVFMGHGVAGTSQYCLPGYKPSAVQTGNLPKVHLF